MTMNLNNMAFQATLHCLAGCAIGEVAGMIIGIEAGLSSGATVALSVTLAFISGYALSTLPLVRNGISFTKALKTVFAADTLSIFTMEVVDNAVMVSIPGAMESGLSDIFFWISMAAALVAAFIIAYPVNLWLLKRGKGHALTHEYHLDRHADHHINHHE